MVGLLDSYIKPMRVLYSTKLFYTSSTTILCADRYILLDYWVSKRSLIVALLHYIPTMHLEIFQSRENLSLAIHAQQKPAAKYLRSYLLLLLFTMRYKHRQINRCAHHQIRLTQTTFSRPSWPKDEWGLIIRLQHTSYHDLLNKVWA